ncbi:hypothetical protein B14_200062 (plasmid) [Bacillus licheniformis]|uniref:hypothetical protein n=1 Tax=Bacillus licheniformis TaxID=1402 RepID=UPI0009B7E64E|nr:hypothetical protein [Bacillus licheniformis]ARC67273.1 hypothetical protein B14_200062 [Bacillus licheniformis]ARW46085.1 hypothetical protein S100141_04865 [Bacillus licheniformis]MDE1421928.1 hypothetical protein [Bacillus licheniformis]MEC0475933.1 hypothetical protein [Bacillus licheniformis]QAS18742.1 hypothetical protein EQJ69_22730 [Bacillus licheniformis]
MNQVKKNKKEKAALSQIEWLERKLEEVSNKIKSKEDNAAVAQKELKELYFQQGKYYSELELMKRVRQYD